MGVTLEFLKLGIVGLISGLFASYLANRDHRNKKWWELRVAAYQNVIESLSDLVYYYHTKFHAQIEGRELSGDFDKRLDEFWQSSFPRVRKAADIGAFLFSDIANTELAKFMALTREHHESYFEYIDSNLVAASTCLKALVTQSKIDLQLKSSWLDRLGLA